MELQVLAGLASGCGFWIPSRWRLRDSTACWIGEMPRSCTDKRFTIAIHRGILLIACLQDGIQVRILDPVTPENKGLPILEEVERLEAAAKVSNGKTDG